MWNINGLARVRVRSSLQSKCISTSALRNKCTVFKWIWKSARRLRHKILFWLLLHDRVNTRNLLKRKKFHLDCYDRVSAMTVLRKHPDIFSGIVALYKTTGIILSLFKKNGNIMLWWYSVGTSLFAKRDCHGDNYTSMLEHLESKKWKNLQTRSAKSELLEIQTQT